MRPLPARRHHPPVGATTFFRRRPHLSQGYVSWNWAAPFGLGCNTIFVNGCSTICFASSVIGAAKVREVRDMVDVMLRELMESEEAAGKKQ